MKGYNLGIVSFGLAIFFGVIFAFTLLYPSTGMVSWSAVALGLGTIVATIYLAVALLWS